MGNPTDPTTAEQAVADLDNALARLWSNTRPKATDVLIRNLRAHAYSYAMDDAALCEDLRQAIGRLEHPSAIQPIEENVNYRLEEICEELEKLGQHHLLAAHIHNAMHNLLRGTK
jgi:hypothetical protein